MPSVMDDPSGGAPEQAPRWDLMDTESCAGGISFLAPYLIIWGYIGISRTNEYVSGTTRRPPGWRPPFGGTRVPLPRGLLEVSRVLFVEKITFPKVSFRLDSV